MAPYIVAIKNILLYFVIFTLESEFIYHKPNHIRAFYMKISLQQINFYNS
jgi:hypothetical protein